MENLEQDENYGCGLKKIFSVTVVKTDSENSWQHKKEIDKAKKQYEKRHAMKRGVGARMEETVV